MTLSNDNGMSQHDADAVGDSPDYSPIGYIAELVEGIVAMADETDGGKLDARAHCEDLIRAVRSELAHTPPPASETGQASAWQTMAEAAFDEWRTQLKAPAQFSHSDGLRFIEILKKYALSLAPSEDEDNQDGAIDGETQKDG